MKRKAKFLRGIKQGKVVRRKMYLTFLTTTIPKSEAVKQMIERMHRISNEMGVPMVIPTPSSQLEDRLARHAISGLILDPIVCPPAMSRKTMAIESMKVLFLTEHGRNQY